MRVISGKYKSLFLEGSNLKNTRPTMDRVKESLFGIIQRQVKSAICLDLFAGSGSLGIEALSNGATSCYFIDSDKQAIEIIQKNINKLNVEETVYILKKDYKEALKNFVTKSIKFDLIFLDPPYNLNILEEILLFISQNNLLKEKGLVICERTDFELKDNYHDLKLVNSKKYGIVKIDIYEKSKR